MTNKVKISTSEKDRKKFIKDLKKKSTPFKTQEAAFSNREEFIKIAESVLESGATPLAIYKALGQLVRPFSVKRNEQAPERQVDHKIAIRFVLRDIFETNGPDARKEKWGKWADVLMDKQNLSIPDHDEKSNRERELKLYSPDGFTPEGPLRTHLSVPGLVQKTNMAP